MITRLETSEISNRNNALTRVDKKAVPDKQAPNFKGAGDIVVNLLQHCEKFPMLNVSVLDLSTAIVPRSIIETFSGPKVENENGKKRRKANVLAGAEAFRRESSGLLINCLLPGFVVAGVAKLIQRPILGKEFKGSKLSNVWADSQALDKISKYYVGANGTEEEKIFNAFRNMLSDLSGADGNVAKNGLTEFKSVTDIDKYARRMTDCVMNSSDANLKKTIKEIYRGLVGETHMSEHIKFNGDEKFLSSNLESLTDDAIRVVREMHKHNIKEEKDVVKYISKAKKLVKAKSLGGMAIILPLAIAAQPINRWITRRTAGGMRGAPIYDEFKDKERNEEKGVKLSPKEKSALLRQKLVSISSMIGVALLSMSKFPSMAMLEFKGIFPSMDMARIVSTSTFASRMATSEDKHELKLSTARDITTFASMYFLGDYAAKGIATLIEKHNPNVSLLHRFKEVPQDANVFKKFLNWAKNTSLKSSDELATKQLKNLRSWCQAGNIVFSLILLGLLVPMLTVSKARAGRNNDIQNAQNNNNEGIQTQNIGKAA
ncbi:hypothetical protein J6S88_04405 [bacterium]|nr:hypothetical protein [bacterium]